MARGKATASDKAEKKKASKPRRKKESTAEIMEAIIDRKALEERKRLAMPRKLTEEEKATVVKTKALRWFQKPISEADFIRLKDNDGKVYARHTAWKDTVLIGPYNTSAELEAVIAEYVKNAKRSVMKRKQVKNLHSVVLPMEETDKLTKF